MAELIISVSKPDRLLPAWTIELMESKGKRPSDYLNIRRAVHCTLGLALVFDCVGDFIGASGMHLVVRIIGRTLILISLIVSIYGNRTYLGRWTPPGKQP